MLLKARACSLQRATMVFLKPKVLLSLKALGGWVGLRNGRMGGRVVCEVKPKGFIKTRVKDSITPSALVFRVDRRAEGWVGGWV
jgi:hypothetical protein